jgi:CheY-like chemotaxis protein
MKKKLNCILLIDDDEAINFVHKRVINKLNCTEKIVTVQNGQEALEYLQSDDKGESPHPDIIFLDINMPIMNGWDFLEEYQKLKKDEKGKVVLLMLTSSLNPDDLDRASKIPEVDGFRNKPLSTEMLEVILKKYFEDYL